MQFHIFIDMEKLPTTIILTFMHVYFYPIIVNIMITYYCDALYPYGICHYLVGSENFSSRLSSDMEIFRI